MPYISKEARERLAQYAIPMDVGEGNYLVTLSIIEVFSATPRYATIHHLYRKHVTELGNNPWTLPQEDWVAANHLAFTEFYRRVGGAYEDEAIQRNGDVYPSTLVPAEGTPALAPATTKFKMSDVVMHNEQLYLPIGSVFALLNSAPSLSARELRFSLGHAVNALSKDADALSKIPRI